MNTHNELLDYFSPEGDANEKIITVKYFYFEAPARLYAARLRQQGIQSFITNVNTITAFPLGDGGIGLHIRERDCESALPLINELDKNSKTRPSHISFHDADHEDIAFEKSLSEQENKNDTLLLFFLIFLGLILIRAFMRSSGVLLNGDFF